MYKTRIFAALSVLLILAGCTAAGVVATSNPLTKLNDAGDLFERQDRPLPAEKLIMEAIDIYQQRDDPHGLGNATREYGDLLRSPAVAKWEKVYRESGFRDPSVTFDNRFAKSSEYYLKAIGYYERAEKQHRETGRFDALTNVYLNMGQSYQKLDDRVKACGYYDKALEAYGENIKRNPTARPLGSVQDVVASVKRAARCD